MDSLADIRQYYLGLFREALYVRVDVGKFTCHISHCNDLIDKVLVLNLKCLTAFESPAEGDLVGVL